MELTFGPFRVLARLGRGGMAETFLAERAGAGGFVKRVCLKRILPQMGGDPEWVRFFQREAAIVAHLSHPNIVGVHEFGETHGVWWMSLELVEGTDLRSILATLRARGQVLPRELVFYVVIEVTKALAHAHTRVGSDGAPLGIVHRDVTPSNVLVSREGDVMLADFGIARRTQDERTRTGMQRGKIEYLSPEQLQGDPVDHRADFFSLGVMMFEMLTGVRPFDGATDLATAMKIARNERRRLPGDTPMMLRHTVHALLHPDPDQRPESAALLLEYLDGYAPGPKARRLLAELVPESVLEPDYNVTSMDVFAEPRRRG